jgi:phosphoglucomutase
MDEAYKKRLRTLLLDPSLLEQKLKVVYTPLHGVGGTIIVPLLESLGMECFPVASQMQPDGFFSGHSPGSTQGVFSRLAAFNC